MTPRVLGQGNTDSDLAHLLNKEIEYEKEDPPERPSILDEFMQKKVWEVTAFHQIVFGIEEANKLISNHPSIQDH
jgi:hypothetical protein